MSNTPPNRTGSSGYRDQFMLDLAAKIHHYGYTSVGVGLGGCEVPGCDCDVESEQWIYTVGLAESGLPELVMTGPTYPAARQLVGFVAAQLLCGDRFDPELVQQSPHSPFVLQAVPDAWLEHDPNRMAIWFQHYEAGRAELQLPLVYQIVWPDPLGRFPQHPLCDPLCREGQPLLAADPLSFPAPKAGVGQQPVQPRRRGRGRPSARKR